MTARTPAGWMQGGSHPAENDRNLLDALVGTPGTVGLADLKVTANGTPNMTVNVAAGAAFILGTETTYQGMYHAFNDATVSLAIAASDPTNPRIDIVVAQVRDAFYSGASNDFRLAVVTGTPAGSPAAPATPANSLVLARVAVAATVTTVVAGNITDYRARSVALTNAYKARAHCGGTQSITNNLDTHIALNIADYDPNGNFNLTTGLYTAPVAAYYKCSWAALFAASNGTCILQAKLIINGGMYPIYAGESGNAGAPVTVGLSDVVHLNAGDTVGLGVYHNFGAALNTTGPTFLTVAYDSAL